MGAKMSVIEKLALALEKSEAKVIAFLRNAPNKYKIYTIPKRTSGHRIIAQPSKELKLYQRKFLMLQKLPVHKSAMAYRNGLSIKDNAELHKRNRYLLKMDFENFFNSISSELFWSVWKNTIGTPTDLDKYTLERLLFWRPSKNTAGRLILSVGAPSSPMVSNFLMYKFDCLVHEICASKEITYTRYADDLTFSTCHKDVLFEVPALIEANLEHLYDGALRINKRKTKFSSMAHNRHVTGVTINNKASLSLGRSRKRYIKHLTHQFVLDKLSSDDRLHLRGLIAFAKHIEPTFFQSLVKKYTAESISKIIED